MNFLVLGHWDTKNQKSFKKVYFAYGFEGLYYTYPSERGTFLEKEVESLLQALSTGGTLESVEAALEKMKREKEQREFAIEKLGGEPKHEMKKKGGTCQEQYRYSFRVDGVQKSFTGKTPEVVYQKVWEYFHCCSTHSSSKATLKDAFLAYYEVRKRDKSKSFETIRYDQVTWNRFFENHRLSNMPIKSISVLDLKEFFGEITSRGALKKKAATKPLSLLKAIYDFAVPTYCEHNVAREINLNSFHFSMQESVEIFTEEQELQLLKYVKALPQDVYSLAVRLAFCFNLRVGELRALTWEDYNEEDGTIHICHQIIKDKVNGHRTWVDVPYTKGNRESGIRTLPVSQEAKSILAELRKINGSKKYILQGTHSAKFPISTERFDDHLKRFCEGCGIPYRSSHKIRFLGITKMYEAGFDEKVIQKSAGHSTLDMTRHYNRDRRTITADREQWEALFGAKA